MISISFIGSHEINISSSSFLWLTLAIIFPLYLFLSYYRFNDRCDKALQLRGTGSSVRVRSFASSSDPLAIHSDIPYTFNGTVNLKNLTLITSYQHASTLLRPPYSTLITRALPNTRLKSTFQIANSFTTTSPEIYRIFRARAIEKITLTAEKWVELAGEIREYAEMFLIPATAPHLGLQRDSGISGVEVEVGPWIQATVLSIILRLLFPEYKMTKEQACRKRESLVWVSTEINDLWIASKSGTEADNDTEGRVERLKDQIRRLTPGYPNFERIGGTSTTPGKEDSDTCVPEANDYDENDQLSLLLPAFETLWRLILHSFLELYYRPLSGGAATAATAPSSDYTCYSYYQQILVSFLKTPTSEQFRAEIPIPDHFHDRHLTCPGSKGNGTLKRSTNWDATEAISCSNVVSELLRLFPPTRRIYRLSPAEAAPDSSEHLHFVGIDIEAIHRSADIFHDPNSFFPQRWSAPSGSSYKSEQLIKMESAFLPFGKYAFQCPAKPVFAPRAVALFLAAFLEVAEAFQGKVKRTGSKREGMDNEMMRNASGRTRMSSVKMVVRRTEP